MAGTARRVARTSTRATGILAGGTLLLAAACSLTTDLDGFSGDGTPAGAAPDASFDAPVKPSPFEDSKVEVSSDSPASSGRCGDGIIGLDEQCDPGATASAECVSCKVVCSAAFEHEEPTTHHCYKFDPGPIARWNDAQASCKAWGGDLASVGSSAEYSFLVTFIPRNTWLGANDIATEGTYVWPTLEPFAYASWEPSYPQDTNHSLNCVATGTQLGWLDRACGSGANFVCERAPLGKP